MLSCCLWHNVETSCHKNFVVVSRHQQTPPITTGDKCHNLPRSGGTALITPSRSQRWQQAVKPYRLRIANSAYPICIRRPHWGVPVAILPWRLVWKNYVEWCGCPMVNKFLKICLFISTESTNVTDGWTDTLPQHSPCYAYASRGKNATYGQQCQTTKCWWVRQFITQPSPAGC